MALSKIIAEGVDLTDNFAFTGTVTGAGLSSPFGNTVAVTSEGGSVTTNLAQGLAKVWVNFNGVTFGSRDSFAVTSLADNGTGNYTVNYTNAMSSANFSALATCGLDVGGSRAFCSTDSHATTSVAILLRQAASNNNIDAADVQSGLLGDLA